MEKKKQLKQSLQPSWKNAPTYADLSKDVDASSSVQEEIREDLLKYKEIKDGGKRIKVKPGKSDLRPKLVRKYQEWKYPAMEEPLLNTPNMFQVKPRGPKDADSAIQNSQLLNYQYDVQIDKLKLVNDSVRTYVDEGTVIVKTGWEAKYETIQVEMERPKYASAEESLAMITQGVQSGQMSREQAEQMLTSGEPMQIGVEKFMQDKEILVKNQPKHTVLDSANVGIDPKCEGDLTKAGFIWHEYDTSYAELIESRFRKLEDGTEIGYYKNIDKAIATDNEVAYSIHKPIEYDEFVYSDKARKKVKAIEYWGYWDIQGDGVLVSIVAEWVNGILVRLEENPFPHKRLPFSMAQYMPVLRSSRGEPDAKILEDNQITVGKYQRAMQDISSTAAVGQEFIDNQFFSSPADKQQYDKGNTVYYNSGMDPKRSIHRRSVDPIDKSIFQVIDANVNEAEAMSGTRPFSGMNGAQGLGVAKMALDATAKRELSVLRRLAAMFVDMAKMVVSMNQAYLTEEQVVRITDREFVTIKREDIQGEFDLQISISTPEKDDQQAQSLTMLLQTNAASMDPELYKIVMGKILRLQYHPDLAEKVEQFEPKPDPAEEQLKQMQLENARLENEKLKMEMLSLQSMVTERNSRMVENGVDRENKMAQAELRLAQAEMNAALTEKYKSETDEIDREHLTKLNGEGESKELAEHDLKLRDMELKEDSLRFDQEQFIKQGQANAGTNGK